MLRVVFEALHYACGISQQGLAMPPPTQKYLLETQAGRYAVIASMLIKPGLQVSVRRGFQRGPLLQQEAHFLCKLASHHHIGSIEIECHRFAIQHLFINPECQFGPQL